LLALAELPTSKRIVDVTKITDHHAIIPTEVNVNLQSLSSDELKVYDLIVRRFISVFYPNHIYNITRIVTEVMAESFMTKGNTVVQSGWMELYPKQESDKNESDEEELPLVAKDDAVLCASANCLEKKTTPPKPYTEATLLSAMENAGRFVEDEDLKEQLKDSGLGTPATRASIIERLLQVGYIERKGKALAPTEKGMKLIEVVPKELKSPETTGKWEKGLSSISKASMEPSRFMDSICRYVQYLIDVAKASQTEMVFPAEDRKAKNQAAKPASGNARLGAKTQSKGAVASNGSKKGASASTAPKTANASAPKKPRAPRKPRQKKEDTKE
jgi:DNA topoisomerase-3